MSEPRGRTLAIAAAPAGEVYGLWGRAFRPFFLALSLYAAMVLPLWLAIWLGALPPPGWLAASWWHGHEMVFGFVGAAIAGFVLTASPVWTGRPALQGVPLAALVALWVAGRVALLAAGALPAALVAATDVAFLPAVALVLVRTLWGTGQLRNYGVAAIVLALAAANAVMHAQALGLGAAAGVALRFAVDFVAVLLLVIGGRIAPAFTRNAFLRDGIPHGVHTWRGLDAVAIGAAAALALATPLLGRGTATGVLATLAGVGAALRLAGWQPWHTRHDPLLWSLHAGLLWVAVGLLLTAAHDLGAAVPLVAGLHALTAGAMGSTILAVITRVALGHTGRPLVLPRGAVGCYALVHAGAALRVASTFAAGDLFRGLLVAGGIAWAAAFAGYLALYAGWLVRPRPDGRPG